MRVITRTSGLSVPSFWAVARVVAVWHPFTIWRFLSLTRGSSGSRFGSKPSQTIVIPLFKNQNSWALSGEVQVCMMSLLTAPRPPRNFLRLRSKTEPEGSSFTRTAISWAETVHTRPRSSSARYLSLPALPAELPVQVSEAISAWRRAAEERDPLAAVVALWESVEFYASGARARKIFDKPLLKTIRERAIEGLEGEQLERVRDILARLNEPPLMVRLRAALDEDEVPYREEELSMLQKIRRALPRGTFRGRPQIRCGGCQPHAPLQDRSSEHLHD